MKRSTVLVSLAAIGMGAWAARANSATEKPYSFRGKSVIVTGGSRGLGLEIARVFAAEGARVALLARKQDELNYAVEDLNKLAPGGAEAIGIQCDVTEQAQVEAAIKQVAERYGAVDVLVNNAGIIQVGPVEHMTVEDFESAMKVHMWGPLYTMLAALPHMREAGEGRVINIASIGGKISVPHLLPYSASKFALVGLSDGMRSELARYNIHVTTVSPGLMSTGSPLNALFKGQYSREYAWFAVSDSLPITAMNSTVAARQIVEASRNRRPDFVVTIQAKLGVTASALAPNLTARILQIVAHLLPGPTGPEGDELRTGWESQASLADSPLTRRTHRAAERNNEMIGGVKR